uniref:N-acetylgalactosaminide beta-1,3-galactosyltransferase n=1 Tax=Rhabditophanes sp. KR3021 TaxID=114890 RepID=A0AC35UI52_9BILA
MFFVANSNFKTNNSYWYILKQTLQFIFFAISIFLCVRFLYIVVNEDAIYSRTFLKLVTNVHTSKQALSLPRRGNLFCFVMTSRKHHKDRVLAINQTFLRRCEYGIFYTDTDDLEEDIPYSSIFKSHTEEGNADFWKSLVALKHSYDNISSQYDWYNFINEDSFVLVENLKHFLKDFNPKIPHFFMFTVKPLMKSRYGSAKPNFVLSNEAMRLFSTKLFGNDTLCSYNLDSSIGIENCFKNAGVKTRNYGNSENHHDLGLSFDVQQSFNDKHNGLLRSAFINHSKQITNRFSQQLISLHHISASQMLTIELLLYHIQVSP